MTTAAEAAIDMARVLSAVARARLHFEAADRADNLRHGDQRHSAMTTELQHAETAGERVHAFLADQVTQPPVNPRDGGSF